MKLELAGGTAQRVRVGPVGIVGAGHEQQVAPFLDRQVLHQRIGQHGPARQQMQHVAATGGAPQRVVLVRGVEERRVLGFRKIGHPQQERRRQVDHEHTLTLCGKPLERIDDVLFVRAGSFEQVIVLMEKTAGRLIVGERQSCTLDAFVGRGLVEEALRDRSLR